MTIESDVKIAEAAIKLPSQIGGVEPAEPENGMWHLLRSLLEYSDHIGLDFDLLLEDVREDFRTRDHS